MFFLYCIHPLYFHVILSCFVVGYCCYCYYFVRFRKLQIHLDVSQNSTKPHLCNDWLMNMEHILHPSTIWRSNLYEPVNSKTIQTCYDTHTNVQHHYKPSMFYGIYSTEYKSNKLFAKWCAFIVIEEALWINISTSIVCMRRWFLVAVSHRITQHICLRWHCLFGIPQKWDEQKCVRS